MNTFSVKTNFEVNNQNPGEELGPFLKEVDDHIWTLTLTEPIDTLKNAEITVSIEDNQGNINQLQRNFSVGDVADNDPQLGFSTFAFKPMENGTTVEFLYLVSGNLTGVNHAGFQLDDNPIAMDNDLEGPFEFLEVQLGQHKILGALFDDNNQKISGTEKIIFIAVQPPINQSPTINGISLDVSDVDGSTPGIQVNSGTTVTYSATATDPENDPISWAWLYRVDGGAEISFSNGNGSISDAVFTYQSETAGTTYEWILRVSNGQNSAEKSLFLNIISPNDTQAPGIPKTIEAKAVSPTQIDLSWTEPTDNVGVTAYRVFDDGFLIHETKSLTFAHVDLEPDSTHVYRIQALDMAGNESELSEPITIKTNPEELGVIKVPIVATDQFGQPVPKAKIFLHEQKKWFEHGEKVELQVGKAYRIKAKIANIIGRYTRVTVEASMTEIGAPFQRITLKAVDQSQADVPDAEIMVFRYYQGRFYSSDKISLPLGSSSRVRGNIGKIFGSWKRFSVAKDTNEVVVPFWTSAIVARNQSSKNVEGAKIQVNKTSKSPISSGDSLTLPYGSSTQFRGQLGKIFGKWRKVQFKEGVKEVEIPFVTVKFTARDQFGSLVSGAGLQIHKGIEDGVKVGSMISFPVGASTMVRGQMDEIFGPWKKFQLRDGLTEIEIPFWQVKVSAIDQFGNPVPQAMIHVQKLNSSPIQPGSALILPKNSSTFFRGQIGQVFGDWNKFVFSERLEEVVLMFRRISIEAVDQFGNEVSNAKVQVYRLGNGDLVHGDLVHGDSFLFPENSSTYLRGRLGQIFGPWRRHLIRPGVDHIRMDFWTTTIVVDDQFEGDDSGVKLHIYKLLQGPLDPGANVSLPKGSSTLIRGEYNDAFEEWKKIRFDAGISNIMIRFEP